MTPLDLSTLGPMVVLTSSLILNLSWLVAEKPRLIIGGQ
jgi:hypothetical protein